jgi:myo-inositol-1(or 4)-monophosphatase
MPSIDLDERLRVSRQAIFEAGALAADFHARRATLAIDRKGVQDVVSEADRACEALIVAKLSAAFPEDGFLGEEGGASNEGAAATWVIDPIDGTHNFLTGVPFWCVSVGLVADGEAVLGLIFDPMRRELFHAVRGGGAFLNGAPIRVSGETELGRARICVGFSYRRPVADHARAVEGLLAAGCEYLRLGSGALGMAYVAAGRFDGYWERHINSWDVAAGLALVREAGGWVSDFLSGAGLTEGREILGATPGLLAPVQAATGFAERA